MTHPHIYSSEQPSGVQYLPLKRKSICDDTNEKHHKTSIDESASTTTISDKKQTMDPVNSTKEAQSTATRNANNTMETTPYYSSNTLESQLPPLPQVIRRTARPCLLQGRTSQRQSTRNVTPDSTPSTSETPVPRWHKQSYMLFLALRQHPWHAMSRTNLIRTAMDLDRTISAKFNYPIVFGGKTPQNSASALLTNNHGRHFLSYRPSGSKTLHFRLAFEPAHFGKAVATYRRWMKTLIANDWPLCFGDPSAINRLVKKEKEDEIALYSPGSSISSLSPAPSSLSPEPSSSYSNDSATADPPVIPPDDDTDLKHSSPSPPLLTEFDEFIAMRQKERQQLKKLNMEKERNDNKHQNQDHHPLPLTKVNVSLLENRMTPRTMDDNTDDDDDDDDDNDGSDDHHHKYDHNDDEDDDDDYQLESICGSIPWKIQGDGDYQEISKIPTCWQDIVYVNTNGNDNDNNGGVYARRRLPINTPLGFYFGTPTVEDEFQLVKEDKGQATYYSLMYGRTVLDATDDDGQPFTDPLQEHDEMYCPFHFVRQANSSDKANVLFLKGKIYNQVICWTKRPIQANEELLVWLKYE